MLFTGYEEMGGRQVARNQEIRFEGDRLATLILDAMEINPELDPALFELPTAE